MIELKGDEGKLRWDSRSFGPKRSALTWHSKASTHLAYDSYLPTAIVLVVGLVLSLELFSVLRNLERSETETEFQVAVSELVSAVQKEFDTKMIILESMAGLYKAGLNISPQDLHEFSDPLIGVSGEIDALTWVVPVRDGQRAEFEDAIKQSGLKDFEILEQAPGGEMVRASQRDEYFPALGGRPQVDEALLGFDVASDPIRAETLNRARDSGEVSITTWVTLLQESDTPYGFLAFVPVYKKDLPSDSVENRRKTFEGFIVGVFRIARLVDQALASLQPRGIDLVFSDESPPQGEGIFFSYSSRLGIEPRLETRADDPESLHHRTTLEVGGRRWTILATVIPFFIESPTTSEPLYGLFLGLLFTGLVGTYLATSAH